MLYYNKYILHIQPNISHLKENNTKEQEKGVEFAPSKQRALIFQGGGALGAYEAGVYRVLYDWISRHVENKDENIFDVIAGTSIGAINGAIILSHFLNNKNADVSKTNIFSSKQFN